ncbi:AP-5 complex subunit mu-1 [Heliangelus exortis]|uniref:AP-5 complex subunit mu-1 n=1 Tax=Heliangelus exortis TaxID=472823 RepID=UPI003A90F2E0
MPAGKAAGAPQRPAATPPLPLIVSPPPQQQKPPRRRLRPPEMGLRRAAAAGEGPGAAQGCGRPSADPREPSALPLLPSSPFMVPEGSARDGRTARFSRCYPTVETHAETFKGSILVPVAPDSAFFKALLFELRLRGDPIVMEHGDAVNTISHQSVQFAPKEGIPGLFMFFRRVV